MDKQYYPVEIEEKWSKIWAERVISNKDSEDSFSQVIPPPNVTGTLHMGHSFQYAIMDFYTRYGVIVFNMPLWIFTPGITI